MAELTVDNRQPLVVLLLLTLVVAAAYLLSGVPPKIVIMIAVCLAGAIIAILRTEMAIHFLIVAMLLSPEVSLGKTIGGTLGRGVTLRLDDLLIVLITGTWFLKNVFYKELNLIRQTPLNNAIWVYSFACLLSTMVGILVGRVSPSTGLLFVMKYIEYFMIYWMVVNSTTDSRQIKRYLVMLLAVALIVSMVAILEIPSGRRVSAPFEGENGEPNTLGGYLLLIICMVLGVILTTARFRTFLIVAFPVLLTPFLFTLSRASYLGFIPALLIFPLLLRKRLLFAGIVLFLAGLVVFPEVLPRAVRDRIAFTFNQRAQKAQVVVLNKRLDTSTSARIEVFSESTNAFLEKPLIGWGVTGWAFIDSQFFRTAVETGILGLFSFLYLIYRLLRMAAQSRSYLREKDDFFYGLSTGFIAGTIGLMVHAVGSNTFIIVRIMEPFWMLCAIVYLLPQTVAPSGLKAPIAQSAG